MGRKDESILIWFNPDINIYQRGSERDFEKTILKGHEKSSYQVLYQYKRTSDAIINTVLNSLNRVHVNN